MLVLKKDIQFLAAIWKALKIVTKTNIRPMSWGLDCKHYLVMYNTIRYQNRSIKDTELSTIHASHCSTRFFNYLKNRNNLLTNMIKIVAYFQCPQVSLISTEVIGLKGVWENKLKFKHINKTMTVIDWNKTSYGLLWSNNCIHQRR